MGRMDTQSLLRALPKVDRLLEREDISALAVAHPRTLVTDAIRETLDALRADILSGIEADTTEDAVASAVVLRVALKAKRSLRRVINATGIVVHTNLGRSQLAQAAVDAVTEVAGGYSTLEYDVDSGERGSRHVHVEQLICKLTGAEAAMAINNNAAAVLLGITGLARDKEAIVSRGQLVEIGGSFRIPDIMREGGARMVEVGTTNKTHLSDYEKAMTPDTGLLLKVHSSNFRVVGFTEEVSAAELVHLGGHHGVPVFEDQGSGVLVDLRKWGIDYEPTVAESIAAGVDLVSCSGDKLLGGPQAGILAGKWHVIDKLKKHPLARAVRLDKMTLAALEVTLRLYLDEDVAVREIPTLRMLTTAKAVIGERAVRLADEISRACGDAYLTGTSDDISRAGGGALPMADIPTVVVALSPQRIGVTVLEALLRQWETPIVARINADRLLLDPRTLTLADETEVISALKAIAER